MIEKRVRDINVICTCPKDYELQKLLEWLKEYFENLETYVEINYKEKLDEYVFYCNGTIENPDIKEYDFYNILQPEFEITKIIIQ